MIIQEHRKVFIHVQVFVKHLQAAKRKLCIFISISTVHTCADNSLKTYFLISLFPLSSHLFLASQKRRRNKRLEMYPVYTMRHIYKTQHFFVAETHQVNKVILYQDCESVCTRWSLFEHCSQNTT